MAQLYNKNSENAARIAGESKERYRIPPELYGVYDVKRGLRDADGKGVVAGLTTVSQVTASRMENGVRVPEEGKLYYRGIRIQDLVDGFVSRDRFGFEEIVYLLLTGELPDEAQLGEFHEIMAEYQILPEKFKSGIIMKMPSDNIMSMMEKCVLSLHAVDPNPDDTSIENVMRQSLELIARFPAMAVYSYQASQYFRQGESMVYHRPDPTKTIAENFLIMLRPDGQYTQLEARLLDLALVLHAEHGGGNNSAFTVHVVTSSGTDTYSAIAAALGSLKGPKHGGANLKVMEMFDDLKKNVPDWKDEAVLTEYLRKLLDKEGFDRSGLIYGMGHAIYSVSDPRAEILKSYAEKLSIENGCHDEFQLYADVERIAKELISAKRKIYKGVCANIDLYSGFVYKMLGIPTDLYTPLFAIARIAGWSAHRIEELINSAKIIRPAYLAIREPRDYVPMDER
ncbi:MAG: citrate/2-methylcitrate synthase [Oscillospiraceae bacterium]|nr:citrate/2-methylcitrate synthase [Oscillospiraceae bacterium]